jgi:hypothetical protein
LYSEIGYVLVTKWNTKCVHVNEYGSGYVAKCLKWNPFSLSL